MTLFAIARILKSIGLKGFVKIEPLTHSIRRFEKLKEVHVGMPARPGAFDEAGGDDHGARRMFISEVKNTRNGILLKFHTIDDRTASDNLVNHFVFVDESNLLPPSPGSHFIHDIIGCSVWMNNKPIGKVVEVYLQSQGLAQDVWVIESTEGGTVKQFWLPAVKDFIEEVDVVHRHIVVRRLDEFIQS